jgi:RimJ/RimL family protein N-acetyltransferase
MIILGTQVILRDEKRENDSEDLFRWLNLEEWNYYDEPDVPFTPVDWEAYQAGLKRSRQTKPGSHTWQVDTAKGWHIGWVQYYQLDEQAGMAFIGICLPEPETWGKGYGTAVLELLIHHLFTSLGLKEIRATTWTGNHRMRHLAEKCGLTETGRSLIAFLSRSGVSSWSSSIIRKEKTKTRQALELPRFYDF